MVTATNFYALFKQGKRGTPPPDYQATPRRAAQEGIHPYAQKAITEELDRLAALPRPWREGSNWDITTYEVACNLIELANSPWTGYTITQAQHDLYTHAPQDDTWGRTEHEKKWDSAHRTVAGSGREHPEPLAPLEVTPLPTTLPPAHSTESSAESDATSGPSSETGAPNATDAEPSEPELERTSWWPRDIEPALSGHNPEPPPTVLHRVDGKALLYPGKVNGIIGPSESGKTWVALHAITQELSAGHNVTFIDFEDTEAGAVHRLQLLGATVEQIRKHFAYIGPDEAFGLAQSSDLGEHIAAHKPTLVVLDGFNAAMTLLGLDLMSNTDATTFAQTLLRPLSLAGPAVCYIDHTPKNNSESAGGIGAQAKRAMTTGAALKVTVVKQFGKGQNGTLRIHVDKDRPGYVRGVSLPGGGTHWAGDVEIVSNDLGVAITIAEPENRTGPEFRPTGMMQQISKAMEMHGAPLSTNQILKMVKGTDEVKRNALNHLVDEGFVTRVTAGRGHSHTLVAVFNEREDEIKITTILPK